MKIAAASVELAAAHSVTRKLDVEERLEAWIGRRPQSRADADSPGSRSVVVSEAARQALRLDKPDASAGAAQVEVDGTENDPRMQLIKSLVEMLTGRPIRLMSASSLSAAEMDTAGHGPRQPGIGIEYSRRETRQTTETTTFEASGTIRSADGRRIDFSIGLAMQRSETETSSVSLRAGNAVSKDPLVINFGGEAASLENQRFSFDLLGDGNKVNVPVLGQGSGFLVLDAVGAGKVASGRQLFGPASGDGFADLAKYDSDANGWIDEADPVFGRLGVWSPDAKGAGTVASLADAGVGAVFLGRAATPFALKDGAAELGAVRSSGVWVGEDGSVGSVQQVDLKV